MYILCNHLHGKFADECIEILWKVYMDFAPMVLSGEGKCEVKEWTNREIIFT